ncbi:hypothetical protein T459_17879 [Capsicum annuum]|uniref:Uncharacterized protein n=1 Tax=Capsicum annuum TaxID=4072 RepID=A0A2G2ZCS7_CAPAN|nr:putative DNA-binding protein RHL1-like [Capsicum annuum]PHT79827.1 hypothetical protein T459_17879 [Capsicum annuum]
MTRKGDNYAGKAPNDSTVYEANKDAKVDDDVVLNKELPSAVDVILSADTNEERLVSKDRSRNKSPQECVSAQRSPIGEACLHAGASKLLIPGDKSQTFCGRQNDICWAVNEAHGAQLAAEAIEMDKGYPVAEFEKFLRSSSPVICPSVNIRTCQACIRGQGAPLCRHEIPNISLGNLWQWYEKHGNYGLEVEAEEHKSSQQHRLKFSAFFVPSLSAVQLIKDNGTLGSIDVGDSGINKMSGSSPIEDFHKRFSVLVPQPRVENSSSLPKRHAVSDPTASSDCSDMDLHHQPAESKLSDDNEELLFEYFENEQPQNRKPLFEKIKELAAGGRTSSSRVFGDPSILQSARLPDLHPHSWFSIAWYPIYRIPTGNFRASFLSYHSLGQYVHRDQTLCTRGLDAGVVSPTVGLLSYNTQGECWFQPRHSAEHHPKEAVTLDSNAPSVLRDRLKTLEQTASFMSRAVRMNGAETLVNKHPDYEFFLSRRCRLY